MRFLAGKGYFEKLSYGSETSVMTSEWLEGLFEGNFSTHVNGGIILVLIVPIVLIVLVDNVGDIGHQLGQPPLRWETPGPPY